MNEKQSFYVQVFTILWYQSCIAPLSCRSSCRSNLSTSPPTLAFTSILMAKDSHSSESLSYSIVIIMSYGSTPSSTLVLINATTQLHLKLTSSNISHGEQCSLHTALWLCFDGVHSCITSISTKND